jgi:hypothetical protein
MLPLRKRLHTDEIGKSGVSWRPTALTGLSFIVLAAVLISGAALYWPRQPDGNIAGSGPRDLLRRSDILEGLHGTPTDPFVVPVTLALMTSAAAQHGDRETARVFAERLLGAMSRQAPGWGIGVAYDAFGDGSVNPPSAIYGPVTGLGIMALLDTFDATGEVSYRDIALVALDHYRRLLIENDRGAFLPYSDQPPDAILVYSDVAFLMGQYARAGALTGREDLATLSDELFRTIWSARWDNPLGPAWPYSVPNPFWNDSLSASLLGYGIGVYAKNRARAQIESREVARYLRSFLKEKAVADFAPHADLKPKFHNRPASALGAGMLAAALQELGDCEAALEVVRRLEAYRLPDDRFGLFPENKTYHPRATAHVLLGLASVNRGCARTEPSAGN